MQTTLTFKNNVFFLAVAIIACTPVIPTLKKLFEKREMTHRVWAVIGVIMPVILIVLSALTLAGDSYNPFLYFQF